MAVLFVIFFVSWLSKAFVLEPAIILAALKQEGDGLRDRLIAQIPRKIRKNCF